MSYRPKYQTPEELDVRAAMMRIRETPHQRVKARSRLREDAAFLASAAREGRAPAQFDTSAPRKRTTGSRRRSRALYGYGPNSTRSRGAL